MKADKPTTVNEYIAQSPKEIQDKLKQLRRVIKTTAPTAKESISYGMPFYDYHGRLVYFAAMKGYIGLYVPPPIIPDNAKLLERYTTTKSAIHLPLEKLPVALIKKLISQRMKHNKTKQLKAKQLKK